MSKKRKPAIGILLTIGILVATTSSAMAVCLEVSKPRGDFWINNCNVYIEVIWNTDGGCESRPNNRYSCAATVRPYGKTTAMVGTGYVEWAECQAERPYEVMALEDDYGNSYCSKKEDRHGRQSQDDLAYDDRYTDDRYNELDDEDVWDEDVWGDTEHERKVQGLYEQSRRQTQKSVQGLIDLLKGY